MQRLSPGPHALLARENSKYTCVVSTPAITRDGLVYFTDLTGNTYALYGGSPLATAAWSRFKGSNQATGRFLDLDALTAQFALEAAVSPALTVRPAR